ncbi:heavy-metal-associated domain-containing protein [Phaeocystidibacter luteus]|uniref:Heavy-metal-associated domain-containing protein n=1 Tax=Phaeocystidibacter luteus TaxID=911197 RepID=A0A6N6RMV2_9FLAO|nr:heavy-metal-associated domain-containing protein [Phaeocystidibacter luteus]
MLVNGICGMCERTIEGACDMDGVESAEWSSETKELKLTYDASEVSLEDINTSINEAGYDTEYSTASEEAYNSIHNCCKYRDPEVVRAHEEKVGNRQ